VTLQAGTRLGPYEILSALGAGGMGEVYRARDTKLDRDVAIKVLPAIFVADPARVARFQREAKTLAALNHPNIAAIYGLDERDGMAALVLELVEGPTLADRIAQGPIPVDEAMPIAKQIAEALEVAHEHGIVHRDLKPANIKLRPDGTVKVLDFGLAKVAQASDSGLQASGGLTQSPTITTPAMTAAGMILGTAAYMSPEQAKGKPADKRSDIWAFGCVLYEMLTGARAFNGDDATDTIAAVIRAEPAWHALPDDVPERIRLLLRRCLEKDRSKRVADISVARFLITEPVGDAPHVLPPVQMTMVAPPRGSWRRAIPLGLAAIVLTGTTAAIMWNMRPQTVAPIVRFSIVLPERQQFAQRSKVFAVSPDGSRIAYVAAGGQLFLRSLDDMKARPIPGTDLDAFGPFFSPDGQWIGFFSFQDRTLKKVAISGGPPVTICPSDPPFGVTWDGDWIVFADQGAKGVLRVSPNGGEPEVVAAVKAGEVFAAPQMINDGRALLFTIAPALAVDRWDRGEIVVQSVGSSERTVILRGGSEARYVPTGHLVYMVGVTLFAVPFDVKTLQVRGGPVPIVEDVRRFTSYASPGSSFAFSSGGMFAYIPGSFEGPGLLTVALASRDGKLQRLDLPAQPYIFPRISPDGKQLAVQSYDGNEAFILIYNLRGGQPARRLTFGGQNLNPLWTPDGRRITFQSNREGDRSIFWQLADGTGTAERLSKPNALQEHRPEAWSPDGKTLAVSVIAPTGNRIFTLATDGTHAMTPFSTAALSARFAAFSPDGKWIAYASNELGKGEEVFVQPFPPTGSKYQISTGGGRAPLWSADGKQLYYHGNAAGGSANLGQRLVAVDVRTQPTFAVERSVTLPIEVNVGNSTLARNYDIMPDGKQFVVTTPASVTSDSNVSSTRQINVVLNWFTELQQRVPTR
jgi:serine/threonine-protein kinase